jgi:hypothetical protein
MKQKLVTIYMDNLAYAKGKMFMDSGGDKHGVVEEHLQSWFDDGWRIGSVTGFGGNSESGIARGWFAVVLQK